MRMFNMIFLIILVSLCYIIARSAAFYNRDITKEKKRFWARESESNFVRKADISALPYVKIPLSSLPLDALSTIGLGTLAKELESLATRKILNLSQYTNTDLKMMYGPANLENLSEYDNNFTSLIRLLNKIGTKLNEAGQIENATAFFEYSISIESDISTTYVQLGQIYKDNNDKKKLDELIKKAGKLTSLSGSVIVTKLNNIKSQDK